MIEEPKTNLPSGVSSDDFDATMESQIESITTASDEYFKKVNEILYLKRTTADIERRIKLCKNALKRDDLTAELTVIVSTKDNQVHPDQITSRSFDVNLKDSSDIMNLILKHLLAELRDTKLKLRVDITELHTLFTND